MKKIIPLILFFTLLIIAAPLYADYKIILKNGREFVVDDYKDLGGKIRFYREGGEIELDKTIIKDIKKTKAVRQTEESAPVETTKDTPEKPAPEKVTQPQKQEIVNRLKEIAKKKEEMKAEGEKLSEERKKLDEDIKKKGRVLSIREKRELEQKIPELNKKIKKFDEEMSSLDTEEAALLKDAGGQQK